METDDIVGFSFIAMMFLLIAGFIGFVIYHCAYDTLGPTQYSAGVVNQVTYQEPYNTTDMVMVGKIWIPETTHHSEYWEAKGKLDNGTPFDVTFSQDPGHLDNFIAVEVGYRIRKLSKNMRIDSIDGKIVE